MALLAVAASAGATTLTLTGPTAPAPYLIVGKNTPNGEVCRAVTVVGKKVTLDRPLTLAKPAQTVVEPIDGGLIPWTWFGAKGSGSASDAPLNTQSFNRLTQQLNALNMKAGIFVPAGTFMVDNELKLEAGQTLAGVSPDVSIIVAAPGFPFDASGEVAIVHGHRSGAPVLYATPGPSQRWFLRDLYIGGQGIPNSNGVLISPQQPESIQNVRVDNCTGLYGVCLVDVQDTKIINLELIGNTVPLRYRGAALVRCFGLNIEQCKGPTMVVLEKLPNGSSCYSDSFYGVHFERDSETVAFDLGAETDAFACYDFFYSNPQIGTAFRFAVGGPSRWVLSNIVCNANSQTFKMVDDVDRGKSLSSWNTETNRWIDFLTPRILMAGYTKTP